MKKLLTKFSIALAGSLALLGIGASGLAAAASISNTGPGSTNIVSGSSGNIDTTGPGSVNIINGGCGNWCGGCNHICGSVQVKSDDKCCNRDCEQVVKVHHRWCWKWSGNCWRWCDNVQV